MLIWLSIIFFFSKTHFEKSQDFKLLCGVVVVVLIKVNGIFYLK